MDPKLHPNLTITNTKVEVKKCVKFYPMGTMTLLRNNCLTPIHHLLGHDTTYIVTIIAVVFNHDVDHWSIFFYVDPHLWKSLFWSPFMISQQQLVNIHPWDMLFPKWEVWLTNQPDQKMSVLNCKLQYVLYYIKPVSLITVSSVT